MKKALAWVCTLLCLLGLTACGTPASAEPPEEERWAKIPMVMVDGVLYLDTGYTNTAAKQCGTPDGTITSAVPGYEEPTENDQSNFGTDIGYQYGQREGTVELLLEGKWRICATEAVRRQIQFPEEGQAISEIRDRTQWEELPCDTAEERFYEDEQNGYYFRVIKSHYVIVTYTNGETEDIVTALQAGRATIADLDRFGIEYHVKEK